MARRRHESYNQYASTRPQTTCDMENHEPRQPGNPPTSAGTTRDSLTPLLLRCERASYASSWAGIYNTLILQGKVSGRRTSGRRGTGDVTGERLVSGAGRSGVQWLGVFRGFSARYLDHPEASHGTVVPPGKSLPEACEASKLIVRPFKNQNEAQHFSVPACGVHI